MLAYHQSWVEDPEEGIMVPGVYWNMWTTRQYPYKQLEENMQILMVSGGGPQAGVIMHQSRIKHLVKSQYQTPEEAWNAFSSGIPDALRDGTTKSSFLKDNKNRNAPNSGWIIAWVEEPIKPINKPRPNGFRFRPNGWGEIADSYISALTSRRKTPTPKVVDEEAEIWSRSDIGLREKKTLVMSRRGQGLFRKRVAIVEATCRVTGTTSSTHRIASHIKPWKVSTDEEKLDGNNGLFLAPHIDHLFDRGFISFKDNGDLLISPKLPKKILSDWGIAPTMNVGHFNPKQKIFLKYHRNNCFKTAQRIDR